MKIALVTHSFFPNSYGGREKHVRSLAESLGKKNQVHVFTCSDSLFESHVKRDGNFQVHFLRTLSIPVRGTKYRIPIGLMRSLFKFNPRIVHAHDMHHLTSVISKAYARLSGKKFVLTEHGYPKQKAFLGVLMGVYERIFVKFLADGTSLIAVSDFIKDEFNERYGIGDGTVVKNWITLGNYASRTKKFLDAFGLGGCRIVLCVARLTEEKGVQDLIEAFEPVARKSWNVKLVIVGDGGMKNSLKLMAASAGLEKDVVFTGRVSDEMLTSAIYCSDVFVIPSLYEPFGIVALEAMAYGKPIASSRTGGLTEFMKDGRNCLFFTPSDAKEMSERIIRLLKDRKLRERMSKNNRNDVKAFETSKVVHNITDIYKN